MGTWRRKEKINGEKERKRSQEKIRRQRVNERKGWKEGESKGERWRTRWKMIERR